MSKRRHGTATVEFAIVAPLFLLLLAGMIEIGQAMRVRHMIATSAFRGARSAIVDGATSSQTSQKIKTMCASTLGVKEGDVSVEISVNAESNKDVNGAVQGDVINVTVSIPYNKSAVGFYAKLFSTATLSANCSMEHE